MPTLCSCCAKDSSFKVYIEQHGNRIATCGICGASDIAAIDCEDAVLRGLFRSLIRFYYSEWEYNGHWGGDALDSLLLRANPITAYQCDWDEDAYLDAVMCFIDNGYEPYDKGISLFAGYATGMPNFPLVAIADHINPELEKLKRELLQSNYFELENQSRALLEPHVDTLVQILAPSTRMCRARIGYQMKAIPVPGGFDGPWHYKPYSEGQLSAPPPSLARAGRSNRAGVSFLYLATDEETAIAEVRPHPGHFVSIGAFESCKGLRIADFDSIGIIDYCQSDKALDQFVLLKSIDRMFSLPVPPEESQSYSVTQLFSDAIRRLGFDGVAYRSSVGLGKNYTLFTPTTFRFVPNSARVVGVEGLQYTFRDQTVMGAKEDYFDGNGRPL